MIRTTARTLRRQTQFLSVTHRAQSTSTIGTLANQGPYGDHSATTSKNVVPLNERKGFSTAVAYGGLSQEAIQNLLSATHNFAQVQNMSVFGKELELAEASALSCGENAFDKIILLVPHGEASCVTEKESQSSFGEKTKGDFSLTSHGVGQSLKTSGKTARYCNNETKLIPQLFVVSPLRCAIETALLSFPYYAPGSIHETQWVCHGACHDSESIATVDSLETSFPSIDYESIGSKSDFLQWLNTRDEKVIAIASTPSWIDNFCNSIEPGHESKDLRAVGIKFTQV